LLRPSPVLMYGICVCWLFWCILFLFSSSLSYFVFFLFSTGDLRFGRSSHRRFHFQRDDANDRRLRRRESGRGAIHSIEKLPCAFTHDCAGTACAARMTVRSRRRAQAAATGFIADNSPNARRTASWRSCQFRIASNGMTECGSSSYTTYRRLSAHELDRVLVAESSPTLTVSNMCHSHVSRSCCQVKRRYPASALPPCVRAGREDFRQHGDVQACLRQLQEHRMPEPPRRRSPRSKSTTSYFPMQHAMNQTLQRICTDHTRRTPATAPSASAEPPGSLSA